MDQSTNSLTVRLAGTVEELRLDRRAYHLLKRHGIHHVADIIARGQSTILNIKGMGGLTASHVFSTLAKYLDIEEKQLFSMEVMEAVRSYQERPFDPLEAPISILDLPLDTLRTLNSLGIFAMRDLYEWKSNTSAYSLKTLNRTEIRRIYTELHRYLSQNQNSDIKETPIRTEVQRVKLDLSTVLAVILRDERTIEIVRLRALKLFTLEEIAHEMGGVTRERIRQIIDQVHDRIRENLSLFSVCCNYFEEIAEALIEKLMSENLTIDELVSHLKSHLSDSRISATDEELSVLVGVIRLALINEKPWMHEILKKQWKKLSFLTCLASPSIRTHKSVDKLLDEADARNRKLGYKELALTILTNEKRPMHWSEIAEKAYRIGRRPSFNSTALYNALMSDSNLFVRVGAGTYALTAWGLKPVDTYPDIIASIMKSQKKTLSSETILHKVNEIRQIKPVTLIMLLDLHPRFYRSLEKTYGLRVWLPEREKQTLRTPEWLIEDGDSYRRLEQASSRGYDVQNILSADLQ